MLNSKLVFLFITAVVMYGCANPAANEPNQDPFGKWRTQIQTQNGAWLSHGIMTFSDIKKATYSFHNGRILFFETNNQGLWKGYWIEDTWGSVRCSIERDGSKTWGQAIFQFDKTYNSFKGTWDRCADGRKNLWIGNRL